MTLLDMAEMTEETFETLAQRVKSQLEAVIPDDIFTAYIENFVFEKVDDKKIVIGYYGTEKLRAFHKEYGETVRTYICSVFGADKKIRIRKRKGRKRTEGAKVKKQVRAAKLLTLSLIFVGIALGVATVFGSYTLNRSFRETFYSVSTLKANNSFRIIQISDLHTTAYGAENQKLIDRVKKLDPDIILYTGDCIEAERDIKNTVALIKGLSSVAPSYYIYGNNEVEKVYGYALSQDNLDAAFGLTDGKRNPEALNNAEDALEKELERAGTKVLKNERDTIAVGTTKIDVFGVLTSNPSSFWSYAGDSFSAYLGENTGNIKITAMHEPLVFETYTEVTAWGDIMLAGHTHGGMVRVPMVGPLYTREGGLLPERSGAYVYGRYEVAGRPLIVSGGLENKNVLRIHNQPELVIVDVNRF